MPCPISRYHAPLLAPISIPARFQKFFLLRFGMNEHHVGVAAPRGVERLPGASDDDHILMRVVPKLIELMDFSRNLILEPFGLKPAVWKNRQTRGISSLRGVT